MEGAELRRQLKATLQSQLGIVEAAVQLLLEKQSWTTDVAIKPVFAETARHLKLNRAEATGVLRAWEVERLQTPEAAQSLFAVINSVTRAAQKMEAARWVQFDQMGGRLLAMRQSD